ncbi:MAG: ABC-type transport auxiliary lipoprotein family protein [Azospira sp.]|jgi:cholesterol transport system auxiliary component|nr:ABC-type transport auxiliary lipoprotein family protein [Azospira sp.]
MNARIFPVLAAALFVAACASGGRDRTGPAIYDLGPVPAPASAAVIGLTDLSGLAVEVRLPVWLDGAAMRYRLAYAEPLRLHAYAHARWASPPTQLLQQRLRQQLTLAALPAPCTLRVELDDFSQSFASPAASAGVLRGEALLFGKGQKTGARLPLRIEVPAASADAVGGAGALAIGADRLAEKLAGWLKDQDLAACRGAGRV